MNEAGRRKLGGRHSARTLIDSVDFQDVGVFQREERWEDAGRLLAVTFAGAHPTR